MIMLFHGYGGAKLGLPYMQPWLNRGYATFSVTTRGFGESCGTGGGPRRRSGRLREGYVRLMDTRYEVRDTQELAGLLADEGRIIGQQIGAVGGSYGGAMSMALAALRNRKMLPDGSLVPWTSPGGVPMRLGAPLPRSPGPTSPTRSPNGSTLDYVSDAPYRGRTGVRKQSFESSSSPSGRRSSTPPTASIPTLTCGTGMR